MLFNRLFTVIITDMYKHSEQQTQDESILLSKTEEPSRSAFFFIFFNLFCNDSSLFYVLKNVTLAFPASVHKGHWYPNDMYSKMPY